MVRMNDEYLAFWGGVFSNFCEAHPIEWAGRTWNTSEQIFMYQKAVFFNDTDIIEKLLEENQSPAYSKRLGRKIKGFNEKAWEDVREDAMLTALRAKFSIPEYKALLLKTGERELIEASPYDKIWGIGFDEDHVPKDKSLWGLNLLGKCLMIVREEFQNENQTNS